MVDDDDAYTSDGADVEKLVWNLAAGYECGAGPYCQDCDWNGILERLTAKEWHGNAKKKSFNNALVVELALEECRCDPTAEELKDLYEKFYSLPMSGKLDDAGMGGAQ